MPDTTALSLLARLNDHLSTELRLVEEYLAEILANERTELTDEVGQYLHATRGKRIRPILTLLAARAVGGRGQKAAGIAAAMECVHVASLLHDDVIDQAPLRRGSETVSRRFGHDVAILMGNYLYSHAFRLMLDTSDPRPLRMLSSATAQMSEGEMFQIQVGADVLDEKAYFRIITDKTAHLIAACTGLGAVTGGADEATIEALMAYGRDLGMAYQIVDDALDYQGADESWGKSVGTDLREGKWTLPLIMAMGHASEADRKTLLTIWNNGRELGAILDLLNRTDSIERCFAVAQQCADRAIAHLEGLPSNEDMELLRSFPQFVVSRTH